MSQVIQRQPLRNVKSILKFTYIYLTFPLLSRLLLLEGGPGSPSCLLGSKHIVSWGFEDMLPAPDGTSGANNENKGKASNKKEPDTTLMKNAIHPMP